MGRLVRQADLGAATLEAAAARTGSRRCRSGSTGETVRGLQGRAVRGRLRRVLGVRGGRPGRPGIRHYADRPPVWIKAPISLLEDDAYLSLTGHERGVLHGLWLLCAKLEYDGLTPRLPFNTRYLSRQLGLRVKAADLEALADTRFIDILASDSASESVRACTH